jgi:antitoxin (DNA-binding transcriptional repressor) of toxin-antitoxin stability system
MRDVSATEAARSFSDLLDAVEHHGEGFAIIRRGKAVARLIPVGQGSGRDVKALLAEFVPDPFWAADLAAIRSAILLEERP